MTALRSRRPVVVTDVDGTLTEADRRLNGSAVTLVRRLERAGIPVVLATGNVLPVALALHRSLGLTGPIVAENGGLILEAPSSARPKLHRLARRAVALEAYRHLRSSGLPVRRLFTDRWRETEVALEPSVPVGALRRALRGRPVSVESTGYAIHLMERGAGKLPAVRRALASFGRTMADAVVLGDGDNDVGMLRAAGFSVSFPSASERARAAATYVTRRGFAAGFVEGVRASGLLVHSGHRRPP